ncbi:MAG TPA: hypothetical protein VLH79_01035 [Chthonomonadales bacterium]|nr:hypothetical protein [Chthonomonadales bacterium]
MTVWMRAATLVAVPVMVGCCDGVALARPHPITVRWEDATQRDVFWVEGAHYRCRVATQPARILSVEVDGRPVPALAGASLVFVDATGGRWRPAPPDVTPEWLTYQFQSYQPARDSRARMNVWTAGPYYWDAHLMDIPLMREEDVAAARRVASAPPAVTWSFRGSAAGWEALQSARLEPSPESLRVAITGADPFVTSPPTSVQGPVDVVLRVRTRNGGGAALYWHTTGEPGFHGGKVAPFAIPSDGEWHDVRVRLPERGVLSRLRFDPPGETGQVEIAEVRLHPVTGGSPAPARGELVFHAHRDHLRIEARVDPREGAPAMRTVAIEGPGLSGARAERIGTRTVVRSDGAGLLLPQGASVAPDGSLYSPAEGVRPGAVWVLRPLPADQQARGAFAADLEPLAPGAVTVRGGHWLGFDYASGLYLMRTTGELSAFAFEPAFKNPTRRLETPIELRGDARPRTLLVRCETGVGNLQAAVLATPGGFPLPVPIQVGKNFAGEREEPDDSGFGHSTFPVDLPSGATRQLLLIHLTQNWGIHPLKQVSSIRFFHIYWHLSTGGTETTCFTMNWMRTGGGSVYHIPDFRPFSGLMWVEQPQRGIGQFPGFLQYGDVMLLYERTEFESVSPCLTRFTMHFRTSDNAATARVSVMEAPQRDEMRTFLRLRYDWTQPVQIPGDARLTFRWLNMNERWPTLLLLWTGPDGALRQAPIRTDGAPMLTGEPLPAAYPLVGTHGRIGLPGANDEAYHSLALIRSFRARLGGREVTRPAASAVFAQREGDYWLTTEERDLRLQPGDYLEAEVMLMPHGEPAPPNLKPDRERRRFGAAGPRIQASIGRVESTFPATVRLDGGIAQVVMEGGMDLMPLVVTGARADRVPLVWRDGVWQDHQAHGGDGYQAEPDGDGGTRWVVLVPTRDGQKHNLLVTSVGATGGIASIRDENGRPVIVAQRPGRFELQAPVLFGPGRNRIVAGRPAVSFDGAGRVMRAVPISAEVQSGTATVEVLRFGTEGAQARVAGGPVRLTFADLAHGAAYRVRVNGHVRTERATDGRIVVDVPANGGSVQVTPVR